MATPVGHTLIGLAVARRLGVRSPLGMVAAAIGASLPDADVIAGCGGGGGDDATPTSPVETPAATPASSPGPSGFIRRLELLTLDAVQALLVRTGGTLVQSSVLYADLTGDGAEDAVVPVSSGGTLGDVAFIVLKIGDNYVIETPLTVEAAGGGSLSVRIEGGQLVVIEPVPGPDDPECCPSMLRRTTYGWNGAALAIVDVTTEPNPMAGVKTPSP